NLIRTHFLNSSVLRHPRQFLRNLSRVRLLGRELRGEFSGTV
ncbi:hypothetical protein FHT28_002426, partial [Rhizobium sp. SG570]|nr:hypothetical protein [Rhizobium sp. SG570]